jgi:protein arginine N-methyltransferase 7
MSFNAKFNATNGKIEWEETDKDYQSLDCNISDEFSRSHYGDMLHDTERNQKYYVGLRWAIEQVKGRGVEPRILDIGTGTGLLSMMAAECGAKHVTACEVFKPMIKIANDTISTNGYDKVIKVIPKRSTDIIIGEDMPEKANILVTEVFDSELIGEGALPTFHHAVKDLLEENAIIIPSEAKVYIQLIESPFLWRSQALNVLQLNIPSSWKQCRGPASLWDVHLEEVSIPGQLVVLSEPHLMGRCSLSLTIFIRIITCHVIRFDFNDVSLVNGKVFPPVSIRPTVTGRCHGVAVWWTLTMSPGVELSMSPWQPNWQWRDHWLPCVQLYTQPIDVIKDELIQIQLISDEYTIWTDVCSDANSHRVRSSCDRPVCTCGAHMAWSRNRLRMINDNSRNEIFVRALQKVMKEERERERR